jgi:hypothetical protein
MSRETATGLSCGSEDVFDMRNATSTKSDDKIMRKIPCSSSQQEPLTAPKAVTPCSSDASSSSYDLECVGDEGIAAATMKRLALHDKANIPTYVKVSNTTSPSTPPNASAQEQCQSSVAVTATQSPTLIPDDIRKGREKFLLFVKILFKCLAEGNNADATEKARRIVRECTKRNRMGDPMFASLFNATASRLRGLVGESTWRRAVLLLRHFMAKRTMQPIDGR